MPTELGRVAAIWRYPVKSMAAEPLDAADIAWHGIAGDRRWAFAQDALVRSDFPWFTIRERSDMRLYRARFAEPEKPDASPTLVTTPAGEEYDVADPALAAELGGDGIRPIKQNRGTFDASPMSLIGTRTVQRLGELAGRELDPQRFRPNLLVETSEPFEEEGWIGSTLRIGGARVRLDRKDSRCVIVNVDPVTAERDPRVLRTVAQQRDSNAGVYAAPVEPGRIGVGDAVTRADG